MSTTPKLISANDLETRRRSGAGPTVLDVRLAEDHERDRIPGALNNCVFEVTFGEGFGNSRRRKTSRYAFMVPTRKAGKR
jgi:rhodanese-related sulfurtransferase